MNPYTPVLFNTLSRSLIAVALGACHDTSTAVTRRSGSRAKSGRINADGKNGISARAFILILVVEKVVPTEKRTPPIDRTMDTREQRLGNGDKNRAGEKIRSVEIFWLSFSYEERSLGKLGMAINYAHRHVLRSCSLFNTVT